jgi:hypothetical protein
MTRWDRWWLNVFATVFMAAGTLLVGARLVVPGSRTVVGRPLAGWVGRPWFPWAVAATGVIVVVCGAAWLVRRLRGTRHLIAALDVAEGPADAPVTVTSRSISRALESDVQTLRWVQSAAATVVAANPPAIELRLSVSTACRLDALLDEIDDGPRARLRQALQRPDAQLQVTFRLVDDNPPVDGGAITPMAHRQLLKNAGPGPTGAAGHSAASASATSSGTSTLA